MSLTQEQIDSINAIKAKIDNPSITVEYYSCTDGWIESPYSDYDKQILSVINRNKQYRIKEKKTVKKYVVKETTLPLTNWKSTAKTVYGDEFTVECKMITKDGNVADQWLRFFKSINDVVITVEE